MESKAEITPRDLLTRVVGAPDGTLVRKKVVKADSPTFSQDLLAAFRSNVRRIRAEQRKRARTIQPAE